MKKTLFTLTIFLNLTLSADCQGCIENRCNQGDGDACYKLGLMYENGFLKKDRYDLNSKRICTEVDALFADANCANYTHKNPNYQKAVAIYNRAISLGSSDAYNGLAVLYIKAKGVKQNFKKAKELFWKSCNKGNSTGCYNYSLLSSQGY